VKEFGTEGVVYTRAQVS